MSYISPEQTAYKDGANLDAFGRLRTSVGAPLFGMSQEYSSHQLVWDSYTVSGGTSTHSSITNSSTLATNSSTSGARALRQTKTYWRYTPGKSQLIKMTGVLNSSGTASGAAYSALGYYDDRNGLFFKYSASGVSVAERSDVSGSVIETSVSQTSWNVDKFDGTGPSGKTVDWTKTQIFIIDLQWLGAGRVRYALDIDGQMWIAHQSVHANLFPSVYMATADLPVRYEVFNSGGEGANIALNAICSSIESEGGIDEGSVYPFSYAAYLTPKAIDATLRPLTSRRLRDTFNGKTARARTKLLSFSIFTSADIYWEIRYNPTITLGAGGIITTANVDTTYSQCEYDTYAGALNTLAGGVILYNGFVTAGLGQTRGFASVQGTNSIIQLARTYANVRDSFTLSARTITGNSNVSVTVQFEEQY